MISQLALDMPPGQPCARPEDRQKTEDSSTAIGGDSSLLAGRRTCCPESRWSVDSKRTWRRRIGFSPEAPRGFQCGGDGGRARLLPRDAVGDPLDSKQHPLGAVGELFRRVRFGVEVEELTGRGGGAGKPQGSR